ncbi:MAG: Gfo/Idh/MocA family oxidoreductase [Kiritimatiellae bacterium]|nr:Gfo/Idh/MocA family oxidoreductase [Kiritimatiellia bacterium]
MINASRRNFLRGLAGAATLGAGGCFSITPGADGKKIRLAAVGIMGKGFSDWFPMIASGKAELVALCDADAGMLKKAQAQLAKKNYSLDLSKLPFYTDYRKLLDNCGALGVQAMTISTPDHVHAAVAVQAMKMGIHVYVQKPLVRTLWELDYFNKTAREYGVVVQMGNQGSSLNSMRRCTEVIQSGILGDVREVHVWTNRPVWPQGKAVADWVKGHPKGDRMRPGLDWNAWLATAKNRPFLDQYPKDAPVYDPWNLGKNVYHAFTWRGFFDFGCGAFGDMACHTMNLAFRGLELADVSDAERTMIESENDVAYPLKSVVKLTYKARASKVRPGVKLPAVTLTWYDGDMKPDASIMPKWAATHDGKVPNTGCYIIGSKGAVLMQDDYGAKCAIALEADKKFVDVFDHEAAKAVARSIPFRADSAAGDGKSSVAMSGFAEGHYIEFLDAINGVGPKYSQTHSRCFSDIEYCIPQMEGILVGCIAQQVPGKLVWNSASQRFEGSDAANALVKPYIREGFAF